MFVFNITKLKTVQTLFVESSTINPSTKLLWGVKGLSDDKYKPKIKTKPLTADSV